MKKILLLVVCFFGTTMFELAAASVEGLITKIDIHSDTWSQYNVNDKAYVSIYIDGMPKSCNQDNGARRVIISHDHPLFDSALSMALAAKRANKKLFVNYLTTCNVRSGAWDFGYMSVRE